MDDETKPAYKPIQTNSRVEGSPSTSAQNSIATLGSPQADSKQLTRKPKKFIGIIMIIAISALAGFGGGLVAQNYSSLAPLAVLDSGGADGNTIISDQEQDVSAVVEKISPSVVSIVTEARSQPSIFNSESSETGAGTGIIISEDGYVLTNKHVVEGVQNLSVIGSDGTTYDDVEVIGVDPLNDIAFLRLADADGLQPAELGNSSTIRIGQNVVAIGNSLGQYRNTVTTGVISGTNRPATAQSRTSIESLTDLIQTDAAINPGNSGGPLLNMQGQVIGVNTAVATNAQGIGFAIPINATKGMVKTVIEDGEVRRAFLGVSYLPITPGVAEEYGLSVNTGAYVFSEEGRSAVMSGGPADEAGIETEDIITKIGDVEVGTAGGVASLVAEYTPGDTIEITYQRDGNERTTRVTLGTFRD